MVFFLTWIVGAGFIGRMIANAIAFIAVSLQYARRSRVDNVRVSFLGLFGYAFPARIISNYWTHIDVLYYIVSRAIGASIGPVIIGVTASCAALLLGILRYGFGAGPALPLTGATLAIFLLLSLLLRDFTSFYLHMLQHRVPLLWEFHKVHHAPESLVPVTGHRLHPLELFLNLAGDGVVFGVLVGGFAWLTNQGFEFLIVCSAGLEILVNALTLSPLRHSHVDVRFGWLEHVLLSPAHHHLHHSVEEQHWDKNFSTIFPFWDAIWQTLFSPPPIDSYRLGLPHGESMKHRTVLSSYLTPFHAASRRIRAEGIGATLRRGALGHAEKRASRP